MNSHSEHHPERSCQNRSLNIEDYGVIADRNCAGLTETSLRIRGYENWYLDTMTDPAGVEKLFDLITEYKTAYWDLVIDWLIENNLQDKVNVISECDDLGTQTSTLLEPEYLRKTVIPRFGYSLESYKKEAASC